MTISFNDYQDFTATTAVWPEEHAIIYPALGLANEAGECLGYVKKWLRQDDGTSELTPERRKQISDEVGDVLWYCAALLRDLEIPLEDAVLTNVEKLKSRKERGTIKGSGDNR